MPALEEASAKGAGKSPFLDLPKEIRDKIYDYALGTLVNFRVYAFKNMDMNKDYENAYSDNEDDEESEEEDEYEDEDEDEYEDEDGDEDGLENQPFFIYPRLTGSTSALFLVNKQVNSEVQQRINPVKGSAVQHYHTNPIKALLEASITGHKINARPSEAFQQLCTRSRFVFQGGTGAALSFLAKTPKEVTASIRSVMIPAACLYGDDSPSREAWSKKNVPGALTPFAAALRALPNLREVDLFILQARDSSDWYCSWAPQEIGDMLGDGTIEVARFLYDEIEEEDWVRQCTWASKAVRPQVQWIDGESPDDHMAKLHAAEAMEDNFIVVREADAAGLPGYAKTCGRRKIKTIFHLTRRYEPSVLKDMQDELGRPTTTRT